MLINVCKKIKFLSECYNFKMKIIINYKNIEKFFRKSYIKKCNCRKFCVQK